MQREINSRLRMLCFMRYLYDFTDAEHPATLKDIKQNLTSYGFDFDVGRKGIASDVLIIQQYNPELIKKIRTKNDNLYYWNQRKFDLPELKLLIESIESSRSITEDQSYSLINKVKSLTVHWNRIELQNQLHIYGMNKTINEAVKANMDILHKAILLHRKIRFHYMQWDLSKHLVMRRDGSWYVNSPYFMVQDQEKLYLVAYDSERHDKRHFRIDKMQDVEILPAKSEGQDFMSHFDVAKYTKQNFGMFSGQNVIVKLKFKNSLIGVAIDRFGRDINIHENDDDSFSFSTDVMTSDQFYGFIFSLSGDAEILAPAHVVEEYKKLILDNQKLYFR